MQIKQYARVFFLIVQLELVVFKKHIFSKVIDTLIWLCSVLTVIAYLGPKLGVSQEFVRVNMIGALAASGFEVYPNIVQCVSDLTGDKLISYYTTLPAPYWVIFFAQIVNFSVTGGVVGFFCFPMVKILLPNLFLLHEIHIIKLLFLYITSCLMFGAFAFVLAAYTPDMKRVGSLWMRVIFPLWFFGGYQFTWDVLYRTSPFFGVMNLLNPFTYVTEGFRHAFSQPSSIPFSYCIIAIVIIKAIFSLLGLYAMKKRLDCV